MQLEGKRPRPGWVDRLQRCAAGRYAEVCPGTCVSETKDVAVCRFYFALRTFESVVESVDWIRNLSQGSLAIAFAEHSVRMLLSDDSITLLNELQVAKQRLFSSNNVEFRPRSGTHFGMLKNTR